VPNGMTTYRSKSAVRKEKIAIPANAASIFPTTRSISAFVIPP
jgi:hypothetical protein